MKYQTYSGTDAAEIVGITYRRLDYWARTDLVRPSGTDATGSGSRRRYTTPESEIIDEFKEFIENISPEDFDL